MANYWINFNKSYFSFKNLCDLCDLCGELNCYQFSNRGKAPNLSKSAAILIFEPIGNIRSLL